MQQSAELESVSMSLTRELYFTHQKEQPITMNSVIAASLFYCPMRTISFKQAKDVCHKLYKYISSRNYHTYISTFP